MGGQRRELSIYGCCQGQFHFGSCGLQQVFQMIPPWSAFQFGISLSSNALSHGANEVCEAKILSTTVMMLGQHLETFSATLSQDSLLLSLQGDLCKTTEAKHEKRETSNDCLPTMLSCLFVSGKASQQSSVHCHKQEKPWTTTKLLTCHHCHICSAPVTALV